MIARAHRLPRREGTCNACIRSVHGQNSNAEVNVTIFSKFACDRCIQCAAIVTVFFSAWFDFCCVQSSMPTSRVYTPSIIAIRLPQTHFVYCMHTCMTIKSGYHWTALNKQA